MTADLSYTSYDAPEGYESSCDHVEDSLTITVPGLPPTPSPTAAGPSQSPSSGPSMVPTTSLVPFIDGGKGMPKLYDGWFNEQVSKQAASAVSRAINSGKTKIEVNFPPVPNVDGK